MRFSFGLLAILLIAFSSATASADPAAQAEIYVKTLSRPVDLYTWEPRASFHSHPGEQVAPQDPRVENLLQDYANLFTDPRAALKYEGPNGIYLATDPFVSREWGSGQAPKFHGDRGWSLIRLTLPTGTRFFDGRMDKAFPPELQAYVQSVGCGARTMRSLLAVRQQGDTRRNCWNAYTALAKKLNVQAVALYFYALAPDYCRAHNSWVTDFVVIDPKITRDYATFVPEVPAVDPVASERLFIRDFWLAARQQLEQTCRGAATPSWGNRFGREKCDFLLASPGQFELPWALPEQAFRPQELREFLEQHMFGCGNFHEDRP